MNNAEENRTAPVETIEYGSNLIVWHPSTKSFELWIDSQPCWDDPPWITLMAVVNLDEALAEDWKKFVPVCRGFFDVAT